jgi:hypothetical protein
MEGQPEAVLGKLSRPTTSLGYGSPATDKLHRLRPVNATALPSVVDRWGDQSKIGKKEPQSNGRGWHTDEPAAQAALTNG